LWFDLSPALRPRFQKLVFPEGLPYDRNTGFGTTRLGLIYEINQQITASEQPLYYQKALIVDPTRPSWNQIFKEMAMWQELQDEVHSSSNL